MATNYKDTSGTPLEDLFAAKSTKITAGDGITTTPSSATLGSDITVSHSDTSSQASVNNSGNTVIQDVTLDGYGHVTNINSTTISTGAVNTGENVGEDGIGVFAGMDGDVLQFKKLIGGSNVTLVDADDEITIIAAASGGGEFPSGGTNGTVSLNSNQAFASLTLTDGVLMGYAAKTITPANIGAVAITGGTMTGALTVDNNQSITGNLNVNDWITTSDYITADGRIHSNSYISTSGNVIAYQTSDINAKNVSGTIENALEKVNSLSGIVFEYKEQTEHNEGIQYGLIAQEVQSVFPEMVSEKDGVLRIRVGGHELVGLLVEAVKEQTTITNSLVSRIETLEKLIGA